MNTKTTLCIVGIVSLFACNLSGKIDDAINKLDIFCTPGEEIECSCENGADGSQTCQESGASFSDCACGETTLDEKCSPGEHDVCVCDGTTSIGTTTCLENNKWDTCLCESADSTNTGEVEDIECDPGDIDACACNAEQTGTHTCTDSSIWGECYCLPPEDNSTNGTPWLLYNKDGVKVNAVFEPVCEGDEQLSCLHNPDERTYPCVLVKYLNDEPLWLRFNLQTGSSLSCYSEPGFIPFQQFEDVFCTAPLDKGPIGLLPPIGSLIRFENKLYWADFKQTPVFYSSIYHFVNGECVEYAGEEGTYYKVTELPEQIQNLFPNSPYTIHSNE